MNEAAIMIRRLILHPTRQHPLVWVSRIALFEHYSPQKLIRNVQLHRGLNIVWGKEEPGAADDVEVDGHGVGKTTFCRLIRYCLGEKHFARPQTRERIRWTFPHGYVGAEVFVAGQRWSVARPIGNSRQSFAQQDTTIEALLESRPQSSFDEFRKTIDEVTIRELAVGATIGLNEPIRWDHLLAWCSRDQECRFQSLWEWRSTRSGSETPQFKKPKIGSIWMLRAVLQLLRDEEIKAEERLFALDGIIQKLTNEVEERKREPDYWRRHYRQRLVREYEIQEAATGSIIDDTDLFGVPARVRIKHAQLTEHAEAQAETLRQLDRDLAALAAQLGELEQLRDLDGATAEVMNASSEALTGVSAETQQFIEELRRKASFTFCRYGGVMLSDCSYVQQKLNNATSQARPVATDLRTVAQNDQIAAAAAERFERWTKTVNAINKKQKELLDERQSIGNRRYEYLAKANDVNATLQHLRTWESYFSHEAPDPQLLSLQSDLGKAENEQKALKSRLTELLNASTEQRTELTRVYTGTVKSVLSASYEGRFDMSEEDMLFTFGKGTDLGGEAMDTLAILLADVTAMLLAAEGRCLHPGILLHDSPREADLGSRIYGSVLSFMRSLHDNLGGNDAAPFQYILTTTTPPPPAAEASVVLPLNGADTDELLFHQVLADKEPPHDVAEELFIPA